MTDKIPREMSDKGTLRDPSKMVGSSHRLLYAVIAVAALTLVALRVFGHQYPYTNAAGDDDSLSRPLEMRSRVAGREVWAKQQVILSPTDALTSTS